DYSLVVLDAASSAERSTDDKRAFLQRYPRISSARGTGFDALLPRNADNASGLEERIQRKLGLDAAGGERFLLIEHLLLRPIQEDTVPPGEREYEPIPVLSASYAKDPYSLALSFVLPNWPDRLKQPAGTVNEFRLLVEQTIREETPAHLTVYLHWLSQA